MKEIPFIETILKRIDTSDESYINALNVLSEKECLKNIVNSVLEDNLLQEIIAKRSYNHSNGFYKVMLYSSDNFKLRLHIWCPSDTVTVIENIHHHRWRFVSKIITGQYTCFDYEISQDGELMNSYYYYPRDGQDTYKLKKAGQDRIKLTQTRILTSNDVLVSKPKELHRVISNRKLFTTSLLIQGKDELEFTLIYNENPINETVISPTLETNDLAAILEDFKLLL